MSNRQKCYAVNDVCIFRAEKGSNFRGLSEHLMAVTLTASSHKDKAKPTQTARHSCQLYCRQYVTVGYPSPMSVLGGQGPCTMLEYFAEEISVKQWNMTNSAIQSSWRLGLPAEDISCCVI